MDLILPLLQVLHGKTAQVKRFQWRVDRWHRRHGRSGDTGWADVGEGHFEPKEGRRQRRIHLGRRGFNKLKQLALSRTLQVVSGAGLRR